MFVHQKVTNGYDEMIYRLACEYMAKTELYDRTLPHTDGKYDKTSSAVHPKYKHLSRTYAKRLMNEQIQFLYTGVIEEIKRHPNYTAQMWIDEYRRLSEEND